MGRRYRGRPSTTGTYKGRKYNGASELGGMKMMDKLLKTKKRRRKKKTGCYIATAVYGNYDCRQVWVLRRYRDDTLSKSLLGRVFIYLYYAVSPTLVKCFGHMNWFKNLFKRPLDKFVNHLISKGVEDTPYSD